MSDIKFKLLDHTSHSSEQYIQRQDWHRIDTKVNEWWDKTQPVPAIPHFFGNRPELIKGIAKAAVREYIANTEYNYTLFKERTVPRNSDLDKLVSQGAITKYEHRSVSNECGFVTESWEITLPNGAVIKFSSPSSAPSVDYLGVNNNESVG